MSADATQPATPPVVPAPVSSAQPKVASRRKTSRSLIGGGAFLLLAGWVSLLLVPRVTLVWGGTAVVIANTLILPLGSLLIIWGVVKSTPDRS